MASGPMVLCVPEPLLGHQAGTTRSDSLVSSSSLSLSLSYFILLSFCLFLFLFFFVSHVLPRIHIGRIVVFRGCGLSQRGILHHFNQMLLVPRVSATAGEETVALRLWQFAGTLLVAWYFFRRSQGAPNQVESSDGDVPQSVREVVT